MATLTEVSFYTRRIIVGAIIFFIVVLISPLVFTIIQRVYLALVPPPPPLANQKYGRDLPALVFPRPAVEYKPTYRLETVAGGLPNLPTLGKVYAVAVNKNRILELERARLKARTLGFTSEPVEEADKKTFTFKHPSIPAEFVVDVVYGTYAYKYKWDTDPSLVNGKTVPGKDESVGAARGFWQGLGLLARDLTDGQAKFAYLRSVEGGTMVATQSQSEANFVRVDLFRSQIDKLDVVTTDADTSAVNVIFSGNQERSKNTIAANYNYSQIIDPQEYGTYVIKTADVAWQELQNGGGHIAKRTTTQVVIREIKLAYFESNQPQEYVQPVIVFIGDGGFMAYVPAIDPRYPDRAAK